MTLIRVTAVMTAVTSSAPTSDYKQAACSSGQAGFILRLASCPIHITPSRFLSASGRFGVPIIAVLIDIERIQQAPSTLLISALTVESCPS